MIRIRVFKASQLLYALAVVVIVVLILILAISYFVRRGGDSAATPTPTAAVTASPSPTLEVGLDAPAAAALPDDWTSLLRVATDWLDAVDVLNPLAVLTAWDGFIAQSVPANAESDALLPDTPDDPERVAVEISEIEGEYQAPAAGEGLRVLIYHTHTYEAYLQDEDNRYKETTKWRSADPAFNIVAVGEALADKLRAQGFEVVHDTTEHEPPKLGTAYIRSLQTLEGYVERGEYFDLILDMHRDAASSANTKPSAVTVNGTSCARLMFLIGNGKRGFSKMPDWEENYKLADALTKALNGENPGLCRDVMVKDGRYNQHISTSCLLVEVGHNKNTLQEALAAMEPLADAITRVMQGATAQDPA